MTVEAGRGTSLFGRLLQRHRLAAGLSQLELARRAGLSRRGISDLERGARRTPYLDTVRRLADCLRLSEQQREALLAASRETRSEEALDVGRRRGPAQVPLPLSSFVGRAHEVGQVGGLLDGTRLLTLTGPGGVGKTRLALAAVGCLQDRFADGIWFVDLARVVEPGLLPQAVATALGVHEHPGRALIETVVDAVRGLDLLLILDNCEHLLAASAQLAEMLLSRCPGVRIMATSREVLRVPAETAWRVPPLSLPAWPLDRPLGVAEDVSQAILQSEAVRLFAARAAAVKPDFVLDPANLSIVAQLCHRLDGLPLAIELAAARVNAFGLEQLAALLGDRFRLLVNGSRTAAPRQQTLRAAVEWSYALLVPAEQDVFGRLAVFAGGWTLDAAQSVCGTESVPAADIPQLVADLADKSLITAEPGRTGEMRYRLLETLRDYGWERLAASGSADAMQRRHAEFFVGLAERADSELRGPRQGAWMWRLEQEHANLQAALRWSLESGETELGLRLAGALWQFWWVHAFPSEGRRWLESLLARARGRQVRAATRARALGVAGLLAYEQGDYEQAMDALEESLHVYRRLGDDWGIGWTLHSLARATGDQDHGERTARLLEESVARFRAVGDDSALGWVLNEVARGALMRGDECRATRLHREALTLFEHARDERGIAWTLSYLAVDTARSAAPAARLLLEESLDRFRQQPDSRGPVWCALQLGILERDQGDSARAPALLRQALVGYRNLGDKYGVAQCIGELGIVAAASGEPERAARLFGAAAALREAIGGRLLPRNRAPLDDWTATARARLGERSFTRLWAVGRALAPDQAIDEALAESPAPMVVVDRSRFGKLVGGVS